MRRSRHGVRSGPSGPDTAAVPGAADFFAAARAQSGHELASVATRVAPVATWRDIVLPPDAVAQLREVCDRVVLSHRVLDEWGFDRRLSHGKGVSALFSGPSGTGKTMAAEVIANELGLDLYAWMISRVVSKWIGETEKNLERSSDGRERDSLLRRGGRAVRQAFRGARRARPLCERRDLLPAPAMETYDGVAILATNLRQHMDEAFLRRLSFVVQFPFPDAAQRQRSGSASGRQQTPVSTTIDFARLARTFTLTGGHVKNVALAAAFSAAERTRRWR